MRTLSDNIHSAMLATAASLVFTINDGLMKYILAEFDLFVSLAIRGLFAVPMLDKFKIDDVVGAIPVHLIAGIWGTLAVVITNPDATLMAQLIGIVVVGLFTFIVSLIVWTILAKTLGIRVSEEAEMAGLDNSELGMDSYPEFSR